MRFWLTSQQLQELYVTGVDSYQCGIETIASFFEIMTIIDGATGESDLHAMASLLLTPNAGTSTDMFFIHVCGTWHLLIRRTVDAQGPCLEIMALKEQC